MVARFSYSEGEFRGQSISCGKLRVSNWPQNFPHKIQGLPRNFRHASGRYCGLQSFFLNA